MENRRIKPGDGLPPIEYVESPRFDFGDAIQRTEGLAYLTEHGYVVTSGALTDSQVEHAKDLFWEFIHGLPNRINGLYEGYTRGDVSRDDPTTWFDPLWPADPLTGICSRFGSNHSPFAWFVRSQKRVKEVFAAVWNDDDLLVSFDAINAFRPWQVCPKWKTQGGWFHVDQNFRQAPDRCCVQGLVSLFDATPSTGGLCVIPRSQKQFVACGQRHPAVERHYLDVNPNDPLLQKVAGRLVQCRAGDLVLWDSRTIHCNTPGISAQPEVASVTPRHGPAEIKPNNLVCASNLSSHRSLQREQHTSIQKEQPGPSVEDHSSIRTAGVTQTLRDQKPAATQEAAHLERNQAPPRRGRQGKRPRVAPSQTELYHMQQLKELSELQHLVQQQPHPLELLRLCVYVCMTPTAFADPAVVARRIQAVEDRQGTSHWPQHFVVSGPRQPAFAKNPYLVQELVRGKLLGSQRSQTKNIDS